MPAKARVIVGQPIDISEFFDRQGDKAVLKHLTECFLDRDCQLAGRAGLQAPACRQALEAGRRRPRNGRAASGGSEVTDSWIRSLVPTLCVGRASGRSASLNPECKLAIHSLTGTQSVRNVFPRRAWEQVTLRDRHPLARSAWQEMKIRYTAAIKLLCWEKKAMTRSRYRIYEDKYPHFLTCSIVGWLPVFYSAMGSTGRTRLVEIPSGQWEDATVRLLHSGESLHLIASSEHLAKEIGDSNRSRREAL